MPNIALIFAGGTGRRMNTRSKPKQFLELHGKPILVYTLEAFSEHEDIDGIILVVLSDWIDYCRQILAKYNIKKVCDVIAGGVTAFESQYLGLSRAAELFPEGSVVLIHDGVRPLIDPETISKNIETVKEKGTAITVTPAIETVVVKTENNEIGQIIERSKCELARAPQSFVLKDIMSAHRQARADGLEFIDSASLMQHYGHRLFSVQGHPENIKITTPNDYYTFRALVDARESSDIFGV